MKYLLNPEPGSRKRHTKSILAFEKLNKYFEWKIHSKINANITPVSLLYLSLENKQKIVGKISINVELKKQKE